MAFNLLTTTPIKVLTELSFFRYFLVVRWSKSLLLWTYQRHRPWRQCRVRCWRPPKVRRLRRSPQYDQSYVPTSMAGTLWSSATSQSKLSVVRQCRIQILHLLCAAFNKPFHFMLCDYPEYTHTDVRLQQLNIYSFHLYFIRTTYI